VKGVRITSPYDCQSDAIPATNLDSLFFEMSGDRTKALDSRSHVVHYGPGIDNILSMTVHGTTTQTYYYVKDHLGSAQALVDASGSIVESYQYDAWGNTTVLDGSGNPIQASAIGNRFAWQGREISWAMRLQKGKAVYKITTTPEQDQGIKGYEKQMKLRSEIRFFPRHARQANFGEFSRLNFRAISRISRAMIFCFSLFFAVASVFAESYPNRPTVGEMNEIVEKGTECVRGVNERCWATQYQTNPVAYRVEPFTNTTFYLDKSLMGAMASKIKSLVPYYVDTNTVYNGTTNIVMLTVPGLWASLEIGDRTNQFTCTPAIGTNAATYGDDPWRIYVTNLQEQYKVLNALKVTRGTLVTKVTRSKWTSGTNETYAGCVQNWNDGGESGGWVTNSWWANRSPAPYDEAFLMYGALGTPNYRFLRTVTKCYFEYVNTNILHSAEMKMRVVPLGTFWNNGEAWTQNTYILIKSYALSATNRYEEPDWLSDVIPYDDETVSTDCGTSVGAARAWSTFLGDRYLYLTWQFNYCTTAPN